MEMAEPGVSSVLPIDCLSVLLKTDKTDKGLNGNEPNMKIVSKAKILETITAKRDDKFEAL
jgi:hypothetical protein